MLKNSKYLYGPKTINVPVSIHFGEFMLETFWKYKDRIALINGSKHEVTKYEQLAQEATNLAVSLTRLGVRKGEVVAIMSENRHEFFSVFVGVSCVGAVVTTMNPLYTEGEIKHILSISKPTYLFCSSAAYKNQEKILKSTKQFRKIIVFDDENIKNTLYYHDLATYKKSSSTSDSSFGTDSGTAKSTFNTYSSPKVVESTLVNKFKLTRNVKFEELDVVDVVGQTDTAVILYSSGTTGLPKGVMLTHHNVISMCKGRPLDFGDGVIMTIGPWFHAMGLIGTFTGFTTGKTFAFLPKFDLESMLKTVERYRVEMLVIVPAVLVALTKSTAQFDFSSVRRVVAGAAPLHKDTVEDFTNKFPNVSEVIQGYGMTECCLAIAKNVYAGGATQARGTVGRVMDNAVVKIIDIHTREPLGPHQTGELCVKGQLLMKGYVGKDPGETLDPEGFFPTGDVGYCDGDGYLFIVDRVKELIKYKANQVAPAELEALLLQHPAVREVAVVGLRDKEAGELPLAFVSLQPGMVVSEEEIQQFVAQRVSNPKHLRGGVRFLDDIPKNPTGKIMRQVLRTMANGPASKI